MDDVNGAQCSHNIVFISGFQIVYDMETTLCDSAHHYLLIKMMRNVHTI